MQTFTQINMRKQARELAHNPKPKQNITLKLCVRCVCVCWKNDKYFGRRQMDGVRRKIFWAGLCYCVMEFRSHIFIFITRHPMWT